MSEICKRCEGAGYFVLIMKTHSIGISTMAVPTGTKVTCPDCSGTGRVNGD